MYGQRMDRLTPSVSVPNSGRVAPLVYPYLGSVVPQLGADTKYDRYRQAASSGSVPQQAATSFQPAAAPAPLSQAGHGSNATPDAGQAPPALPVAPVTVGTPSWPNQWQKQNAILRSNVSVPVNVMTQPELSVAFMPPQASQDLGPMVPLGVAFGMREGRASRCLLWGMAGLALAALLKKG